MESTKEKSIATISEKQKEKIFAEFLDEFVIERNKKEIREKEVLLEKVKLYTKGKNVVLKNYTSLWSCLKAPLGKAYN